MTIPSPSPTTSSRRRRLLGIGGPIFNACLVVLLMSISFATVALPETDAPLAAGQTPNELAFAETDLGSANSNAAADQSANSQSLNSLGDSAFPDTGFPDTGRSFLLDSTNDAGPLASTTQSAAGDSSAPAATAAPYPDRGPATQRTPTYVPPATIPPTTTTSTTTSTVASTTTTTTTVAPTTTVPLTVPPTVPPTAAAPTTLPPTTLPPTTLPPLPRCEDFTEQPEAQAVFDTDPEGLAHMDGDGDGRACEQLPGAPPLAVPIVELPPVPSVAEVRASQSVFGLHTREAPWYFGEHDYVTRLLGKAPNTVLFFSNWASAYPGQQVEDTWAKGATPQIAWEPVIPGADQQPVLNDIANGVWDPYIDEWANAVATHNKPIVIRFASEMNGNWYPWSEQVNGNNEGDFVDAWRHVHDRFDAAGADNVIWLWSVNRVDNQRTNIATYWPGAAYVDWVGMSGYWRGLGASNAADFGTIYNQTITELRALSNKPILLAEVGAGGETDADRLLWASTLFAGIEANPDVIGFVYFNDIKSGGDWRMQYSQLFIDAIAAGVNTNRWPSGVLPPGMDPGERLSVPAEPPPEPEPEPLPAPAAEKEPEPLPEAEAPSNEDAVPLPEQKEPEEPAEQAVEE